MPILQPGAGMVGGAGGAFGGLYLEEKDNAVSTTTSDTFQEKLSLSTGAIPAGKYRLEVSYMWNHNTTQYDFEAQVEQDDTTQLFLHKEEPSDSQGVFESTGSDQRFPVSKVMSLDLADGSYQFDLDYRTGQSGQSSSIWDAVMTFWRVS